MNRQVISRLPEETQGEWQPFHFDKDRLTRSHGMRHAARRRAGIGAARQFQQRAVRVEREQVQLNVAVGRLRQRAERPCCRDLPTEPIVVWQTIAVLVDRQPLERELIADGHCEGEIAEAPRGAGGFGYDPLFLLPTLGRTLGELTRGEKNRFSARAAAARALVRELDRLGI